MKTSSPARWPWLMLVARTGLFFAIQALFALGFFLSGAPAAWEQAANWWPFVVTIANVICLALLVRLFAQEGKRYWDLFRIERAHVKGDLLALLGLMVLLGPVSYLPNVLLGQALFGDPQRTLEFVVRPLPLWAAYASIVIFPVTIGLVELATYFLYAMPRLEAQGVRRWLAVTLASLGLAAQHIGLPLLFDGRYLLWRGLMFVPFALLAGITLRWRPRLLPYMALIHAVMDIFFATMALSVAY